MHDDITDMYYLRARYYAPDTGRFTQAGTYHGDGLNLYVYAGNNPVKYVDPSGHCSKNNGVGSGSKAIDDLINGLKETTNGKGIARNFEALHPTIVKDIQTQYGSGKVGTLSDGTKVVARQGSTTGGATLEIKVSNSKVYKIRY